MVQIAESCLQIGKLRAIDLAVRAPKFHGGGILRHQRPQLPLQRGAGDTLNRVAKGGKFVLERRIGLTKMRLIASNQRKFGQSVSAAIWY